ncbi:MAG: hypothetical protein AABY22_33675 [Nanoarchaeota archaeon]
MIQKILCKIWFLVWKKWLYDSRLGTYYKVLKVSGWRTALISRNFQNGKEYNRSTISPCFWWFK